MPARNVRGAGGGGGGSSSHTPVQAPDSLHSTALARIVDLIAEGELGGFKHGLANAMQDIYLNGVPIVNSDGSVNFQNVVVDSRAGTQNQSFMPGFPDTENEIAVGVELQSSTPWIQSLVNLATTSARVTLSVPQLFAENVSNGDTNGYSVAYEIDLQTDGGSYVTLVSSAITGKTTSKFQKSHTFALPPATSSWNIRVRRTTANLHSLTTQDTTSIDSYAEIVDTKVRYANMAAVGLIFDSEQFSSIPTRAYDMFGRIIQVPTNYNPVTRVYTGVWDGTFKPAWTNNPAWIYYDALTNDRFGFGNRIAPALIDKWGLYTIAQYCDEMVDDLKGGTEPRFTAFIYQQTQVDGATFINNLTSIFRGIAFWAGGAVQASADMPGAVDYCYTAANVIGGAFSYTGSQRKTRYTVAQVDWNDPENFGIVKTAYVPDREGLARYGIRPLKIRSSGATSVGQAIRTGLWALYTSRLETETVSFKVGLDGTLTPPGSLIEIADPARAGKRMGGRVHSATTTIVTVDRAPDLGGSGDSLTCVLPSGVSETHTINSIVGNVITVATAFTVEPAAEATWAVSAAALALSTWRVLSIAEPGTADPLAYTVTALAHNASKFAAIDVGLPITVEPTVFHPATSLPAPLAVALASHVVTGAAALSIVLDIGWDAAEGASVYTVQYRKDAGPWTSIENVHGLSYSVPGVTPGYYEATVRAAVAVGVQSLPTAATGYTVPDPTGLPTAVVAIGSEAAAAASNATLALASISSIASDNVLSAGGEKSAVINDYTVIANEQAGIDAQATAYSITTQKSTYDSSVSSLTSYLGGLTSPVAWNNQSGNTTIVGTTFRSTFAAVYAARQALLNAIYAAAKSLANGAQTTANGAQTTANTALTNAATASASAATAQTAANAANTSLAAIASDNILSQGEKPPVINDYSVIVAEQAGIDAQATAYTITTEKTAYDAAVTALTSYLGTLTTPTLWSNLAGDTTIVGTTFRTKFAAVYTTRQTLLNAIYAGAKAKADAAQGTANTANANGPAVINPQFANSMNGWTAGGTGWSVQTGGANLPDPVVNTAAVHTAGGGAASTDALVNAAHIPVVVGQQVTVTCCVNEVGVNAGALGYARISWRDASNTEIGSSAPTGSAAYPNCGAAGTGTYTKCVTKVIAPAPAGAQYAIAEPTITGHTAGTFLFSNVCMTAQPSSVGEVPDGGGRYGVHQVDSNNLAIIDFTQAGHVSKNVDNIGDGSTYARIRNNQLFNGVVPSISFGTNLIPNPTFSNNNSGAPNTVSANGAVSDGWTLAEGLAGMTTVYRESTSSGTDINVSLNSGFVVPASLSYTPTTVSCSAAIDVTAGRNYKLSMTGSWQANASIPAGISMLMRVRIAWYTGGGTYLGEYTIGTGAQNTIPAGASNITAPAYAQKAFISLQQYISNSNASSVTISGLIADMRFNSVYFGMMTNLDDEVQDGSTYARPLGSEMTSGVHKLGIAGSGKVLGNQYNAPNSLTMTYGAAQSTTSLSATSAGAVSIAAFTIYTGSVSASYSAVTNAVTGLSVGSSYYIYCHDAGGAGGTKTWYAATTVQLAMQQGDDVVFAGKITIPASGTSGGGGTGCPVREAWVIRKTPDGREYCRAGDVEIGDELLLADWRWGYVSHSQATLQPCVRVVGECGKSLSCSESAPLGLRDGGSVLAPESIGEVIRVKRAGADSDHIVSAESIGRQWVQHITCEDDYFWTGDEQDCLFSHHNMKPP